MSSLFPCILPSCFPLVQKGTPQSETERGEGKGGCGVLLRRTLEKRSSKPMCCLYNSFANLKLSFTLNKRDGPMKKMSIITSI